MGHARKNTNKHVKTKNTYTNKKKKKKKHYILNAKHPLFLTNTKRGNIQKTFPLQNPFT